MKNDDKTPATRFDVGTTVEVKLGVADWVRGTVVNTNITHKSLPAEWRAPYEVEISGADEDDLDSDVPSSGRDVTLYRGVIAGCNYMGIDRPDCLFARGVPLC